MFNTKKSKFNRNFNLSRIRKFIKSDRSISYRKLEGVLNFAKNFIISEIFKFLKFPNF